MREFTLLLIILIGVFSIPTTSADADEKTAVVEIPDAGLKAALLKLKKKRQKEGDEITMDDLTNVYTLHATGLEIADLTGLEHCRNLADARLGKNKIHDVSPLAKCSSLQSLSLQQNNIDNIAVLGSLVKLQYLNIENNQVLSLAGLEPLQALTSLYASHNSIESLEPAAQLHKLWTLSVNHNRIKDLSPLKELKGLQTLGLAHNEIEDVSAIPAGNTMYATYLQGNKIKDISPLATLAANDASGPRRFAAFWRLYLAANPLDEASQTTHLETLKSHGVRLNLEYDK